LSLAFPLSFKSSPHTETFYYLAGLGDLLATSLSPYSHNRRFGELPAQGKSLAQIKTTRGLLPEKVKTLRVVLGTPIDISSSI